MMLRNFVDIAKNTDVILVQKVLTNTSHVTSCIIMLKDVIKVSLLQKGQNEELDDALVHEWNNIPQAFIQRLIGSMRRRCEAVVAARGGHTRYLTQGFDAQYLLHREKKSTKIV
jgi:hypothetical protein